MGSLSRAITIVIISYCAHISADRKTNNVGTNRADRRIRRSTCCTVEIAGKRAFYRKVFPASVDADTSRRPIENNKIPISF